MVSGGPTGIATTMWLGCSFLIKSSAAIIVEPVATPSSTTITVLFFNDIPHLKILKKIATLFINISNSFLPWMPDNIYITH